MHNNVATIESVSDGVLAVRGDLTATTAVALQKQGQALIAAQTTHQCTINLQHVNYSTSVGVALLTVWMRFASTQNKTIRYEQMPAAMRAIVELSGLTQLLTTGQ